MLVLCVTCTGLWLWCKNVFFFFLIIAFCVHMYSFHEQQSFSEATFLCHICCCRIFSVDLLLILFHVFTYVLGCVSA